MSSSSPSDLATTFRSIPRRVHEAQGDAPPQATAAATSDVQARIAAAASLMSAPSDPGLLADAIENRPADQWNDADLDQLRSIALELGKLVRTIESLAESAADG